MRDVRGYMDIASKADAWWVAKRTIPSAKQSSHFIPFIVHISPCDALASTRFYGEVLDFYLEGRVPPEPGHGDVSFWYAT
jgi:hypothetical protein